MGSERVNSPYKSWLPENTPRFSSENNAFNLVFFYCFHALKFQDKSCQMRLFIGCYAITDRIGKPPGKILFSIYKKYLIHNPTG